MRDGLDTVAGELGDEEAGEILATLAGAMDKDGSDTISLKELKGGAADAMEAFGMDRPGRRRRKKMYLHDVGLLLLMPISTFHNTEEKLTSPP